MTPDEKSLHFLDGCTFKYAVADSISEVYLFSASLTDYNLLCSNVGDLCSRFLAFGDIVVRTHGFCLLAYILIWCFARLHRFYKNLSHTGWLLDGQKKKTPRICTIFFSRCHTEQCARAHNAAGAE